MSKAKGPKPCRRRLRRLGWVWVLVAGLVGGGCGAAHHRKVADRDAARVIQEKTPLVPNMETAFALDRSDTNLLEQLPVNEASDEALGLEKDLEVGARVLSLEKALAAAVAQSREYQTQRELLFLAALNLTVTRNEYTPIFSSGASARLANQPQDVARAIDQVAGTQTSLIQRETEVVQQYNASGSANQSGRMLLRSGARLLTSFNIDFLRFLNGDARLFVRSTLAGTLTQPLLRGAGYKVTMENLTQGERSMLYALRQYTQFRKDFAVRVAQAYYGTLRERDTVKNTWRGYQSFQRQVAMQRALAEEGRIPRATLGQIEQRVLSSESQWIAAIRNYRRSLDQFKILLGFPTETRLMLDESELEHLGIMHPELLPEQAVEVAMATRLDLATAKDQREDATRQVVVAANSLKPQLDVVVNGSIDNKPDNNNPFAFDTERARGSAGLNLELPVERTSQRAAYRSALIRREQADRQFSLLQDNVKLEVLESWRALDQAKRNYELNGVAVKLAERRVEEQELRAELGKTDGLALVDAQLALVETRNSRTGALVDHTINRLRFWNSMGILYIKDHGRWEEPSHVTFK